ncbi:MAG: hypothetical protein MUC88_19505 [Planctomycetes bacterium]|nr:hypothetical protein [Planctomycetota bacterium]
MIRLLYMLSVLMLFCAAGVFALWARQGSQDGGVGDSSLEQSSAVAMFLQGRPGAPAPAPERVAPLVAQANSLAAHLNPPAPAPTAPAVRETPKPLPAVPAVRPAAPSPKFRVCGTSHCEERPERSMALIAELGNPAPARWVKTGTQVGHLVIQEIRPGSIVCRDGARVQEMVVERENPVAAATAEGGGSPHVDATAKLKTDAARLSASSKRPTRSRSMTAGSPRTAALK